MVLALSENSRVGVGTFGAPAALIGSDVSATTTSPGEVQLLREENAVPRAQTEWLKKQLFGAGRSEKLDRSQLLLKLTELGKLNAAPEAPKQTITYERIGEERTFEVDLVPPQLHKREIVRPKFKRRDAREQPPVIAPALARPMQGGYASAGLLAWMALSKYVDHAPLYWLEQMSAR